MPAILRRSSSQDRSSVGVGHVKVGTLDDVLLKMLNKSKCIGMLNICGHRELLS